SPRARRRGARAPRSRAPRRGRPAPPRAARGRSGTGPRGRRSRRGRSGPSRLALPGQADYLGLEVLLEALLAVLAADAALAVAAEGRVDVEPHAAVHRHRPGADAARDAERALLRRAVHGAGEAVDRVVRDAHRVVVVLVGDHAEHGPEDLLLRDRHARVDVDEERRLDEEARARGSAAADEAARALALALLDVAEHALLLAAAHLRPLEVRGVRRVAEAPALEGGLRERHALGVAAAR